MMAQESLLPANQLAQWLVESFEKIKAHKYDEAEELLRKAEESVAAKNHEGNIYFYKTTLCFHKAMNAYTHSAYIDALKFATEGLEHYGKNYNKRPATWVNLSKIIGDCALQLGDYVQARQTYILIRDNMLALDIKESYAESLVWIAKVDRAEGKYEQAIKQLIEAYNILYELKSSKSHFAASKLASLYGHDLYNEEKETLWRKKEEEARNFGSRESKLGSDFYGEYTFWTFTELQTRSITLSNSGKRADAISEISKWIAGAEQTEHKDSILLANAYWLKASNEYLTGRNVDCMKDLKQALVLIGNHRDDNRKLLYHIWNDVARCLNNVKSYDKALNANKQAILNASKVFGSSSIEVAELYQYRAYYNRSLKDYNAQIRDFCTANTIIISQVREKFSFLDKQDRASYWRRLGNITTSFPQKIMEYGNRSDNYTDSLYQHLLFSKGLLLNVDIDEKIGSNRDMAFLDVKLYDIKEKLTDQSVAIEFCESIDLLDTLLCAVVLNKKSEHSMLIPLCKPSELDSYIYMPDELFMKIWQPMLPYLQDVKTVYFSPVGILNVLPIESYINMPFKLYRVSTTRILADKNIGMKSQTAVLYGGLRYDMTLEEMLTDEKMYQKKQLNRNINRNIREALDEIPYLPGSKKEAEEIGKILKNKNIKQKQYTSTEGTESSFKALDKNGPHILHIATHGFVFPTQKDKSGKALLERIKRGDEAIVQEIELMNNSGLLFAGAQNKYDGVVFPDGSDDGILTAQEISTLDLKELNLVTLSACETAKGDITGDGVFGLQRGFKKAGANSILMSLWKVDDEATCKLMTEFYSNWIAKKMTKHDALEAAKKTVRETKGWEDPKYWAAFILLDGLD